MCLALSKESCCRKWYFHFLQGKKGNVFMNNIINFLANHIKEIIYGIIAILITFLGISCFIARDRDEIHTSIAIKIVKTISATIVCIATVCSLPIGIIYLFFFSSLAWWGQIFLSLLLLFVWFFVFSWVCSFFSN